MSPGRTRSFISDDSRPRYNPDGGKRYGIIIRNPVEPAKACDETDLSCTAYGLRLGATRDLTGQDQRTILSSCGIDEHVR